MTIAPVTVAPDPVSETSTSTLPETGAPVGPATGGAIALIGMGRDLIVDSEKSADLVEAAAGGKYRCMYIGIGTIVLILLVVIIVMALRGRTRI